jgi:hypothetical protein
MDKSTYKTLSKTTAILQNRFDAALKLMRPNASGEIKSDPVTNLENNSNSMDEREPLPGIEPEETMNPITESINQDQTHEQPQPTSESAETVDNASDATATAQQSGYGLSDFLEYVKRMTTSSSASSDVDNNGV